MNKKNKIKKRDFIKLMAYVSGSGIIASTGMIKTKKVRASSHNKCSFGMGSVPTTADTMDPVFRTSGSDGIYNYAVYEGLVRRGPDLTPGPELAESWSSNNDGSIWTFKLRQEVTWHNGKPFVAADVIHSYKRIIDPEVGSPGASNFAGIDPNGMIALDDHTVQIKLKAPDVDFPNTTVFSQSMIVPEGSGKELSTNPIGTGAFKAEGFMPGEIINRFVKNENYWGDGPYIDELDIVGIGEREARVAALLGGQIDIASQLNPSSMGSLQGNSKFKIQENKVGTSTIAYCHTDTPPFDNNDLRLAIKYATNRQQMLDLYYQGKGALMNDTPIPGFIEGGLDVVRELNIKKAKEHLSKAGYPNGIDLKFEFGKFTNEDQWATIWQQQLAQVGIRIELQQRPTDGYWGDVWLKEGHPFAYSGWNVRPTHAALGLWYVSTANWNESRFKSETFDANYAKAKATVNKRERIKLYHACIREVADHAGHFVPFIQSFMDATTRKVSGHQPTAGTLSFNKISLG